jgi:hypothetical protein
MNFIQFFSRLLESTGAARSSCARNGRRYFSAALVAALLPLAHSTAAQSVPPASVGANSDPTYQKLRNISLGEAVSVTDLTLQRDAGVFHLHSGMLCFLEPVGGRITGAVFQGDGSLTLTPPTASEMRSLSLLTREPEFNEQFNTLVLRFTDGTYDEIKKAAHPASQSCDAHALQESQNAARKRLRYNIDGRILQDLLGTGPGGFFIAFISGKRYSDRMVYAIDPHGVPPLAFYAAGAISDALPLGPEEVVLMTYADNKAGYWAVFHLSDEYKSGTATGSQKNSVLQIEHQQLDTTIDRSAHLSGKADTTFVSRVDGLKVVPFNLHSTLRVSAVTDSQAHPLGFIQEDKFEDPQFFVILSKPLAKDEKTTLHMAYDGKNAVSNEGSENYSPIAREDWYPNAPEDSLGDFSSYDMTFRIPKGMKIAATGTLVTEKEEGGYSVSVWKSEVPLTVAGFNFGNFKREEGHIEKPDYQVTALANTNPPSWVQNLLNAAAGDFNGTANGVNFGNQPQVTLGNLGTTAQLKQTLSQGEASVQIYTDYFGPIPFKSLALTQQSACNFGQSWPGLVWLPICSFFDGTVRHQLGLDFGDRGYWKIVTPHEVAHQWWGHLVGFSSYRDQWMSEGFADMSASLFLQAVEKNPQRFITFWNDERELIIQKNKEGFRAIDAGALTMGYRLNNSRTGVSVARDLIYPKGAYILHMIRMMMSNPRTGDQTFKETMQDFAKTYAGKAATTEDFKAVVEKHMTPQMDLEGNHRMDWFFNEYVYGTALPSYKFDFQFDAGPDGVPVLTFKLAQSGVDEHFRMLVPIYLDLGGGRMFPLGSARITGNTDISQRVPLKGLKETPKRALINYYDDVLSVSN